MKRHVKIMMLIAAAVIVMSTTVMVFAASPSSAADKEPGIVPQTADAAARTPYGCNAPGQRACYTLMWDDNGGFVSKEAFGEQFDAAVKDGYFLAEDKDYFFEMYDYCSDMVADGLCGREGGTGCGAGGGRRMGGCGR